MSLVSEGADLSKPLPSLAEPSLAGVEDYIALLKPRVMSLVVFTALVGMLVAPGHVHPVIGFTALLCIAIGLGGGDRRRQPRAVPDVPHHLPVDAAALLGAVALALRRLRARGRPDAPRRRRPRRDAQADPDLFTDPRACRPRADVRGICRAA